MRLRDAARVSPRLVLAAGSGRDLRRRAGAAERSGCLRPSGSGAAARRDPGGAGAAVGPNDVRVQALVSGLSAGSELLVYARARRRRELPPDLPTVGGDFAFPHQVRLRERRQGRRGGIAGRAAGRGRPGLRPPSPPDRVRRAGGRPDPAAGGPAAGDRGVQRQPGDRGDRRARCASPARRRPSSSIGQGVRGAPDHDASAAGRGRGRSSTVDLHARRREASTEAGADHALARRRRRRGAGARADAAGAAWTWPSRRAGARRRSRPASTPLRSPGPSSSPPGTGLARRRWRWAARSTAGACGLSARRYRRSTRPHAALGSQTADGARHRSCCSELPLAELVTHRFPFRDAASRVRAARSDRPSECLQVVLDYV